MVIDPGEIRVASLLPSATEIVCALGLRGVLVGRSHECDFPRGVESLPVLTAPKIDPSGPLEEIHHGVEALLAQTSSVYRVDARRLRSLRPTHVVTQVQCEVCAVSLADVEAALSGWSAARPSIIALRAGSLEEFFDDIGAVADALGVAERGTRLGAALRRRMKAIAGRARSLGDKPSVVCLEWLGPLMAGGNWMPQLVEMAGGFDPLGRAGEPSRWIEWEEIRASDPDVLLLAPCGLSLPRLRGEASALLGRPEWGRLRAVLGGRTYLAEASQYFNRPGPRLAESLEILAEILHPEVFAFGHRGAGWIRWEP